jgi:hypothetical protein
MASILPTGGTCEKYERFFCSSSRDEQKPLSVFENPSPFARNHPRKKTGQTGKNAIFSLFGRAVLEGKWFWSDPP